LHIGVGPGDNKIRAISTVKRIYRNADGDVLYKSLKSIKEAYGSNSSNMRDVLISAVAIVFNRYGDSVDVDRMIDTLQKFGKPNTLIANAQAMMSGKSNLVTTTGQRLTKNRLSEYPMNLLPQQVWVRNK
jgi:L-asparaginase/Glu-tRNA(Gln) amidotransferase subunit D